MVLLVSGVAQCGNLRIQALFQRMKIVVNRQAVGILLIFHIYVIICILVFSAAESIVFCKLY